MSWIEEREQLESQIPEEWNMFCIALEQSTEKFGSTAFARAGKVFAISRRIDTCVHIVVAPVGQSAGRAMDVCIDKKGRRIFSRENGQESEVVVWLKRNADGHVCFVDARTEQQITTDQVAERFLGTFFFGEAL